LRTLLEFKIHEWDTSDDDIFVTTLKNWPDSLSKVQTIQFAIHRKDFSAVRVDALKDQNICKLLLKYRQSDWLVKLVAECSEEDRESITGTMPLVIVDYHLAQSQYFEACKVALQAREFKYADSSTIALLEDAKKRSFDAEAVIRIGDLWATVDTNRVLPGANVSLLLCKLLRTPKSLTLLQKEECLRLLGKDIILLACRRNNLGVEFLLGFSSTMFKSEVESCLLQQYGSRPLDIAKWYDRHGFPALAAQFIRDRLKQWNNCDLLRTSRLLLIRPQWLFQEFKDRSLSGAAMVLNVLSPVASTNNKEEFWKGCVVHGEPPTYLAKKEFVEVDLDYLKRGLPGLFHTMERRGHYIEILFLQMHLQCDAVSSIVRRSLAILNTRQQVHQHLLEFHQHLLELLRIWAEGSAMKESPFSSVKTKSYEDVYALLMRIYFGIAPTSDRCHVFTSAADTVTPLLMAFGPATFAYCRMHSHESPHNEGLLQSLVAFHAELGSRYYFGRISFSDPGRNRNTVVKNDKPMSKKEVRKQKQGQAKQQQDSKPATGGGVGSKKKRNNNKKKKGRR
jgi:hypothetical protein